MLYTFTGGNDGGTPASLTLSTNGNFYTTMVNGGSDEWGVICRLTPAGTLTPLYPFTDGSADGANPFAALLLGTNGNFYGSAQTGGTNGYGTIFQLTPAGAFTGYHAFARERTKGSLLTNSDGSLPSYALTQGTNGNLYGTTEDAGIAGYGTIFEISYKGAFTLLYSFSNTVTGATPEGVLLQSGGNFYGTTSAGGSNGDGTIFEISSGGQLTSLYSFTNGFDGAIPEMGLIKGNDGNFYGTATAGGANGSGAIFQITPAGKFTTLYAFSATSAASPYYNPDGATPRALILGADGNFYGAAYEGGANGAGTIFQFTSSHVFTTLYSFTALDEDSSPYYNADGANPIALLQSTNGNFYGTAYNGGSNGLGTFFTIGLPPQITTQPTNIITGLRGNVTFSAGTSGASGWQWLFDGSNLTAGTSSTLSLTNVQPANAGYYQLVVTNANGAVTSSIVSLSISNAPISFSGAGSLQWNDGQFSMEVTNLTGQGQLIIEVSSNLVQWTPIFTNAATYGSIQVIDSQAASSSGFYRAVIIR